MKSKKKKSKIRNPKAIPAKKRKAGTMKNPKDKRKPSKKKLIEDISNE